MKVMQVVVKEHGLEVSAADCPKPTPGVGEVLIEVHAAGITPTELGWSPTTQAKDGKPRVNAIPAHEFSGVVAACGPDADPFSVGQMVYGMNDWYSDGALAEFCVTQPSSIAIKPIAAARAHIHFALQMMVTAGMRTHQILATGSTVLT